MFHLIPENSRINIKWDLKISEFIDNNNWDIHKLNEVVGGDISRKISLKPLPLQTTEDKFVWGLSNNGNFSVKTATWLQNRNNQFGNRINLLKKMWKLNIPPKVKMFVWFMIHERLQTKKCLIKFVINIDKICPICNKEEEDQTHLFIKCHFANKVWNLLSCNSTSDIFLDWMDSLKSSDAENLSELTMAILNCWQIWAERNNLAIRNILPVQARCVSIAASVRLAFSR